jgi:hypothetical protein
MSTSTDPFADFDFTRYNSVANLPLLTMVSLVKSLVVVTPEDCPAHVESLVKQLDKTATQAELAMIVRLREDNEGDGPADLALDNVVDPLWSLLRQRLGGWAVYARGGLDFLEHADDLPLELDIETLRDKTARASEISERLFGRDGLRFVQRPYAEQAQHMANVLGLIDTDELGEELIELTGPELLPMLRHCQARYERMVQARSVRDIGSAADLRTLRDRLRRLVIRYAGAVITMLDESAPETRDIVEAALMPMLTIRSTSRPAQGWGGGDHPNPASIELPGW